MIADWERDVAKGLNLLVPCDMDAVLRLERTFSLKRTAHGGHRTLDVLQAVASTG